MRLRSIPHSMKLIAAVLMLCLTAFQAQANVQKQQFITRSGIVVMGYGSETKGQIVDANGKIIWSGTIKNNEPTRFPLSNGAYELQTQDDVKIVSNNLSAYLAVNIDEINEKRNAAFSKLTIKYINNGLTPALAPVLKVVPVPWVKDSSYSNNPPSFASSHVIFLNVATRLKAVISGGVAPYSVTWDPGDGSGFQTPFATSDAFNGASFFWTYHSPNIQPGQQFPATVRITDSNNNTVQGRYWMIAGSSASQADRINRSTDEGLWYLHTQLNRIDNQATTDPFTHTVEPVVNIGYLRNASGYSVHPSSMMSICLENTGHSITGGKNFSNDPSLDAYVDDLNRLINYLTDATVLAALDKTGFTHTFTSLGTFVLDTHGPGGVSNGIVLLPNVTYSQYEGGPQMQAIAQAGFTNGAIPNRKEYASYYDLLGDFVDGFQYLQAYASTPEGGWRYTTSDFVNDSDGSAVAWVSIGLRAAQVANRNTPGPATGYKPFINVAKFTTDALNIWLATDQVSTTSNVFAYNDKRLANQNYDQFGGMGYTYSGYGPNEGKTGGGLVALALAMPKVNTGDPTLIGAPVLPDARVNAAVGFLYRNFYNRDYNFGWSSARDAYAMYNMLKGLTEFQINTLTDTTGTGGNDRDGFPLAPVNWFSTLSNFIAGTSDTDLGHQQWPGNPLISYFNNTQDGHFEPNYRSGEWGVGASDGNGQVNLITPWDIATLQSAVFVPPPVPIIAHPSTTSNENYIPITLNNQPYQAIFDLTGSYEQNPSAAIIHAHWDFGDGNVDDYDLPFPGNVGGKVDPHDGLHPAGNQTHHHYTAVGDYTVTLTITDSAGTSNAATVIVHVIPAPFPPTAVLSYTAQNGSHQDGDTVGVLPNGTVTIAFDASSSFNIGPSSVQTPKNAKGISSFMWEWPILAGGSVTSDPINPAGPYNSGLSEIPNLFDEGGPDTTGLLNPGSKDAMQVYKFQFNPNNIPSAITIGLQVTSNIVQTNGQPPNTATIFKQIPLKKNADVNPGTVQIKNLYVHNITTSTAIVSFDTASAGGADSTNTTIHYGASLPYTLTVTDGLLATHHDVLVSGLSQNTVYNYLVNVTDSPFGNTGSSSNATFKTQASGSIVLNLTGTSSSRIGNVVTIAYKITNASGADAINVSFGTFGANNGASFGGTVGVVPTTILSGQTVTLTVRWNLPSFPFGNGANTNKLGWTFKTNWNNSANNAFSKTYTGATIIN